MSRAKELIALVGFMHAAQLPDVGASGSVIDLTARWISGATRITTVNIETQAKPQQPSQYHRNCIPVRSQLQQRL